MSAGKHGGGHGWADVWKRGFFGWEYKGRHKDLDAAYDQLLKYREALENPPLLVACDMDRIVVHTNFTGTRTEIHDIPLAELGKPRNLEIVRNVFEAPHKLKPGTTSEAITQEAASRIADIALALRQRGLDPHEVAQFLDRIVFALFAEDIGLLPARLFSRLIENSRGRPDLFHRFTAEVFEAMAHGGYWGPETIRHFNGNLFQTGPVLELTREELESIERAARLDWSAVDPSIFGTLFERGMDPDKRSQLGAHYTSREDIETLVEPVVLQPLRREWAEVRRLVEDLLASGKKNPTERDRAKVPPGGLTGPALRKARVEADLLLRRFWERLAHVRVLDPACGSGNFLYVTLQKLKDLEKEVILYAFDQGFPGFIPHVGPWQLHGIEINLYAFELAQMSVWIGYLQWIRNNGFGVREDPVLRPMDTFECKDAILDLSDPDHPREPEWPRVDFIVGNPPFLGGKKMRTELGDVYVDRLFELWQGRVPAEADLCCYWFEKARGQIEAGKCRRAGLLATQGIRGGANRVVLKRIKEMGNIFFAESDRPWILEGAAVHVSMVAFDAGHESLRVLDGRPVESINANLTTETDVTAAVRLRKNRGLAFQGPVRVGDFDVSFEEAHEALSLPNPNGKPNSDVLRPTLNGNDITKRIRGRWVVDFSAMALAEACQYEVPFRIVEQRVKTVRLQNREPSRRARWWLHGRVGEEIRSAVGPSSKFLALCQTAKHINWIFYPSAVSPEQTVIVVARSDSYFFGVLHSRLHEVWALKLGTRLETRPRYTPTTCFETFPFPSPTPDQETAISAAAKELDDLRSRWLNPPEWTREEVLEFPGSVDGPWARYVHGPDGRGIGTVHYPRLVPKDEEAAKKLHKRTLTNLYNERPTWLDLAHRRLDEAVFAAYDWDPGLSDEKILARLLALNLERAAAEGGGMLPLAEEEDEISTD